MLAWRVSTLDMVSWTSVEAIFRCGRLRLRADAHHAYVVALCRLDPLSLLTIMVGEELGLVCPARVASGFKPRPIGGVCWLTVSLVVTLCPLSMPQHLAGNMASG
jgi:hypothetical protein